MTHEDIQQIKKEFDERYVQIVDCNTVQQGVDSRFAIDDKRIDRIMYLQEDNNNKLTKNNWLTITILTVIIGIVVNMIFKSIGG